MSDNEKPVSARAEETNQGPDAAPAANGAPAPAESGGPVRQTSAEARELERQLEEVREQVKAAEARAQENLDRWQRAQADLANFRRRAQFEREEHEKYAVASLVGALLPVLDSFERAWDTLPGQFRRLTWLSGVAMIHAQLRGVLERVGLQIIDAEGQPFDPAVHEAVDRDEGEGPPHVVAVLQAGYRLHERVLRPALVKVGPPPPPAPQTQPASQKAEPATAGQAADEPSPADATAGAPADTAAPVEGEQAPAS